MANLDLKGTLRVKNDAVKKTETFTVREFIVEVPGERYSDFYNIQLSNDKCSLIDDAKVGDILDLKLNVRGRKWEKDGKTMAFVALEAWKITIEKSEQPTMPTQQISSTDPEKGEVENELPF